MYIGVYATSMVNKKWHTAEDMDTVARTTAEGPLMDVPMVGTVADIGAGDTNMAQWMYAVPFVGSSVYAYDSYKDNMKKQADFYKNTGRHVKYGTDSYSARAYRTIGAELDRQIGRGKRAVRNVMDL